MEIKFIDNEEQIIQVKTKELQTYNIDIVRNKLMKKGKTTIQSKSIFKYGLQFVEYYDQLKEFIEKHEKIGNMIRLPENNTELIVGFDKIQKNFFIYNIFEGHIARIFKLEDPSFNTHNTNNSDDEQQKSNEHRYESRNRFIQMDIDFFNVFEVSPKATFIMAC